MTSINKQIYASIAIEEFGATELYADLGGASIQSDVDYVLIQTTNLWFKVQSTTDGLLAVFKKSGQNGWETIGRKTFLRSSEGKKSIFEQACFELFSND